MSFKNLSIKRKVMIIITSIITIVLVIGILFLNLFYKPYYSGQIKKELEATALEFKNLYNDEQDTNRINDYLDELSLRSNVNLTIVTDNKDSLTTNSGGRGHGRGLGMSNSIVVDYHELSDIGDGEYRYYTQDHKNLKMNLVSLAFRINDNTLGVIYIPEDNITRANSITVTFFIGLSAVMLIVGVIASIYFSREITKPVLELKEVTSALSELNFDRKYECDRSDEIGMLGQSINTMSVNLEKNIGELEEARDKLQRDIHLKDRLEASRIEFIANVSHELKTPLSLIMGYAEALNTNLGEAFDRAHYSHIISNESQKMNALIKDLLDLSNLEEKTEVNCHSFDLSALVDEVLDRYAVEFRNRQINVVLNKEDIVPLSSDSRVLEKILTNYMNNAIEYLDEKGEIKVSLVKLRSSIILEVYNSGTPIPEDIGNRIWESFYKGDKDNRTTLGGSGIGLYIVSRLADKIAGAYGYRNEEAGVSFYIEIKDSKLG